MNFPPEVNTAIRTLLTVLGTSLFIKPGIMDAPQLEMIVGGVVVLLTLAWSFWSKRSKSSEAQQIAQKVMDDPDVPGPFEPSPDRKE